MSLCRHYCTGVVVLILLLLYLVALSDCWQVCFICYDFGCKTVQAMGKENPHLELQLQ